MKHRGNRQLNLDIYRCDRRYKPQGARSPEPVTVAPRLIEVARLLLKDKQYKEIAFDMGIGEQTVKIYVDRLKQRLGLKTRLGVALWAYQNLERLDEPH